MRLLAAAVIGWLFLEPAASLADRAAPRMNKKPASGKSTSGAAEKAPAKPKRPAKYGDYNPEDDTVEMFEAMDEGQIDVKVILKDSKQARVFIKNKTGKPLNVKLPDAFAAMPVLAQVGMGGGQGAGGGMGAMGGGGGGGMFNVPAEKEGNFKVPCVCLEHGKPEPRPQMPYVIKPIAALSTTPGVAEMLTDLGNNKVDQRAAQAAAWHLNNGMSWERLAAERIDRADGSSYPYFSQQELLAGMQIAQRSLAKSEAAPKDKIQKPSPGETAAKRGV